MHLQIAVFRALSSAVERRIADPEVTGSIPVVPLFCFLFFWFGILTALASVAIVLRPRGIGLVV